MRQSTPHREVPVIYDALVRELRRHIRRRGWTMQVCDDMSGLNDGHTAHCLTPHSRTGRVARYQTLDLLVQALVGSPSYEVLIVPSAKASRRRRRMPDPMQRELPLVLPPANGNAQLRLDLRAA